MVRRMSPALLDWLETAHLFGVLLWIAGLVACLRLLRAHAQCGERAVAATAGSTALLMDIGATVAIAAGLVMALGMEPMPLQQGWLHIKLTFVVLGMLSAHGLTRAKLKRAKGGEAAAPPAFLLPGVLAIVAVIVALAVTKPL